jgi:integrase
MTAKLPELVDVLPPDVQLDGELIAWGDDGNPDFHRLGRWTSWATHAVPHPSESATAYLTLAKERTYNMGDNANGPARLQPPGPGTKGATLVQAHSTPGPTTDRERYTLDPTRTWSADSPGIYYRLRKGGAERIYVVHWNGKIITAGPRLSDAKTKQAELRRAVGRGERPVLPAKVTFAELAEQWWSMKQERLRPNTRRQYRDALDLALLPAFGTWRVQVVDAHAISQFIRDVQTTGLHTWDKARKARGLGRSSVLNYCKPLQGVLALAVRRNLLSASPFDCLTQDDRPKQEEQRPPHEWAEADVQALLEGAKRVAAKPTSKYDYTPVLRLTATLGLRLGEVIGLTWPDFDVQVSVLTVRQQFTRQGEYAPTKTKASVRRIAVPSDLRAMLIDLKLAAEDVNGPIFASGNGTPLGRRNLTRRGFEAARDEAGLPEHLTFHDLRHAAASRLIARGLDAVTVADVIGHDDPNITLRVYAHMFDRAKSDAAVRAALEGLAA